MLTNYIMFVSGIILLNLSQMSRTVSYGSENPNYYILSFNTASVKLDFVQCI